MNRRFRVGLRVMRSYFFIFEFLFEYVELLIRDVQIFGAVQQLVQRNAEAAPVVEVKVRFDLSLDLGCVRVHCAGEDVHEKIDTSASHTCISETIPTKHTHTHTQHARIHTYIHTDRQ